MSEFSGRVVLITGVTGGLGGAVARVFLAAGATVAGVATSAGAIQGDDTRFLPVQADLTTEAGAGSAVDAVVERYGRLDALVHLVGGFAGGRPIQKTGNETWERMMSLNLNSAFYTIRAALPLMLEAGRGRVLAVGSRTGVDPAARLAAYAVSKAGLIMLVRTVAAEVRNSGITANVVLPSVIDTPANRASDPSADFSKWVKPESIADVLLWLASDAAADVNGVSIPVYGRA